MAAVSWTNSLGGDWNVATNWSALPSLTDDATISAPGPYIVTISSIDVANSLTFDAPEASLLQTTAELIMVGALTVRSGFVSLDTTNIIGGVAVAGGVLAFGNAEALGSAAVTMTGGELLASANLTLDNPVTFSGTPTIAAEHGMTLNEDSSGYAISGNTTLDIGSLGQDGTILWHTNGASSIDLPATVSVNVQAGMFEGADGQFSSLLNGARQTAIASGAAVDVAGFDTTISDLVGGGAVVDSGGPANLTLAAANFSGTISGPLSLVVDGTIILSGANTYTGTTTIQAGDSLQLGLGLAAGSIAGGDISDAGTLAIDLADPVTLTNAISGSGSLKQIGTGVTSINTPNTYAGGTSLSAGTLAIGDGGALGTGALTITNGELLGTASATFGNDVDLSISGGAVTFAAAPDTTLTLTGALTLAGDNAIDIGAAGQDGDIVWDGATGGTSAGDLFDVLGGMLTAGSSDMGTALGAFSATRVEAGATLDWAGNAAQIENLQGAGTVTNSGAEQTMTLDGDTNFSGTISGPLSLVFNGDAALSGLVDAGGSTTLHGPITLANAGAFDITGGDNVVGTPASAFVNNGQFEKTGEGVTNVSTNFVNNGVLDVLSGSLQFTGGFTNNGFVDGIVTESGGVTTISEQAPSDFNADGLSDILFQNTDGNVAVWDMNGTDLTTSADIANPGPNWQTIGAGDFNGNGQSDILFQNIDGTVAIWNTSGNSLTGSEVVADPGPSWHALGQGDFNGNGQSDILFQNIDGTVAIWDMTGTSLTGSAVVADPGSSWHAISTGDFDGDGHSDILFRNTDGRIAIWEMNGNNLTDSAVVADPGPSWNAIGTGDFNADGHSDILLQNSGTGQLSILEMNGVNVISSAPVATNPGPNLHAIGTGDFNGDGFSDILLQNASGQVSIWEMNGTNVIASGNVSANPGLSWRAIGT